MDDIETNATASKTTVRELLPNLYQILPGGRAAHTYLMKGRHSNVLIDSGLPSTWPQVQNGLAEVGLTPADVNVVLLTHEHIDHAGGAPYFPRQTLVGAHRLAASKLSLKDEFSLMNQAFELTLDDFHIGLLLAEGTVIDLGDFELHVLHTPGHCSGAVCFYEARHHVLFSGDTIMANGVIGGVLGSGNVSDYLNSMHRLAMLKVEHLLPGHGRVSTNSDYDIKRGTERLEQLLNESKTLFDAVRHSQHSFDQILRSLRDLNLS